MPGREAGLYSVALSREAGGEGIQHTLGTEWSQGEIMDFSAVKHRFKPISVEACRSLMLKHGISDRGEQSVYLDEVGLDVTARKVVGKAMREWDGSPLTAHSPPAT